MTLDPNSAAMDNALSALNERFGREGAIRFEKRFGGDVAVLRCLGGTAVVAVQGAQVLSWIPSGGRDVLWLSPLAALGTGRAVRGGIPICWPWFGPASAAAGGAVPAQLKPTHGFVRAAAWDVVESSANDREVKLRLSFDATGIDPALWPHQAMCEIEVILDNELIVSLVSKNVGTSPFDLTQALHTYLAVADVAEIVLGGLDHSTYIDKLQPGPINVQHGAIQVTGEIDRIYQGCPQTVQVVDRGYARVINVAKIGSNATVIWNPWVERSARLGDMGADGYRAMICVEAANAGQDVVTLAPGARHQLVSRLSITAA